MVLLESKHISPNSKMSSFRLSDPFGKEFSLTDLMGEKGLVIYFTCNHCPYAIAIWERTMKLAKQMLPHGINTVAINPNIHPNYPADSVDAMKEKIKKDSIEFPYLVDESQDVAKAYNAQCTPDIYVLTPDQRLFYHGQFDDNWKNEDLVTTTSLKNALSDLLNQKGAPANQMPSMGCSIKWQE